MSRRVFALLLITVCLILFHLAGHMVSTRSLWTTSLGQTVQVPPTRCGKVMAVVGDRPEIALVDPQGNIAARQPIPHAPAFPPSDWPTRWWWPTAREESGPTGPTT